MIPNSLKTLRSAGVLVLAVLLVSVGVRPAHAAGDDAPADDTKTSGTDTTTGGGDKAPAAVPQLQLDDEGPSAREAKKRPTVRLTAPQPTDTQDDKPFYKSWVFWAVTGVLVAGAVGAVLYSTSGTRGALSPGPATVTLSLGCYGAGRN